MLKVDIEENIYKRAKAILAKILKYYNIKSSGSC